MESQNEVSLKDSRSFTICCLLLSAYYLRIFLSAVLFNAIILKQQVNQLLLERVMNNLSKTILILFLVVMILIIFFALTGIDLRQPEQALLTMIDKLAQLNRALNRMVRNIVFSIQNTVRETFNR